MDVNVAWSDDDDVVVAAVEGDYSTEKEQVMERNCFPFPFADCDDGCGSNREGSSNTDSSASPLLRDAAAVSHPAAAPSRAHLSKISSDHNMKKVVEEEGYPSGESWMIFH